MALCKESLLKLGHGKALCPALGSAGIEGRKRLVATLGICLLTSTLIILLFDSIVFDYGNKAVEIFGYDKDNLELDSEESPTARTSAPPKIWHNLLVGDSDTYESTLLQSLSPKALGPGTSCYNETTKTVKLEGLPNPTLIGTYILHTDKRYYLTLVAYREDGIGRCSGGDYYEVDLHNYEDEKNATFKARLPAMDLGNGKYTLELIVPSRFSGIFIMKVTMTYSNWRAFDPAMDAFSAVDKSVLVMRQKLHMEARQDPSRAYLNHSFAELRRCTADDFLRTSWQGRWTRSWFNSSCQADEVKRFRCVPSEHFDCEEPWCFGTVGKLDSNGWVYSAHCSFKIFDSQEAWDCIKGRWFLFWGDSTSQDTLRNLLLFTLDCPLPIGQTFSSYQLNRYHYGKSKNPQKLDEVFQHSIVYNGHHDEVRTGEGMKTLTYEEHRQRILSHFKGTTWPDTIILNSGIHDCLEQKTFEGFSNISDYTIQWWMTLYESFPADRKPHLIWRTQLTPAWVGLTETIYNPPRMEMFNSIFVEKLQKVRDRLPVTIVDGFDLSFPWHYDNDNSDGPHYGRPPGFDDLPWSGKPHWYFVDLMLTQIYLNAVCPSST